MAITISKPGPARHAGRLPEGMGVKLAAGAAAGALALSAGFLFLGAREYADMHGSRTEWQEISEIAAGTSDTNPVPMGPMEFIELPEGPGAILAESAQAAYIPDDELYKPIDLAALQAINPDVSGYIYIPGTPIDYPILKEPDAGKYIYINRDMYRKPSKYGSIFELSDQERGLDSPITWVFGHHMQSGNMFSALYNFLDADWAGTPIYVYRDGWRCEYRAFGACVINEADSLYRFGEYFRNTDEYGELLSRLQGLDRMSAGGAEWPGKDGDIMVLSTCYGGAGTSDRIVVLCREARRAVTPAYYTTLLEAQQYGGSQDPMTDEEKAAAGFPVDGSGAVTGMPEMAYPDAFGDGGGDGLEQGAGTADGGQEQGGGTDPGTPSGTEDPPAAPGDGGSGLESSMQGLLGGG